MLHDFQKDWQMGRRAPIYLFYGTETFQMEQAISYLREQLEQEEGWEVIQEDLEETPIQKLVLEAESSSLFSEQKLIVGRNAYFLTSHRTKSSSLHETDSLSIYLDSPNPDFLLVLTVPTDKLDKRKKLVKALEKKATVYRFDPLKGVNLAQWTYQRLKSYGAQIEKKTLIRLIELVGTDLRMLDTECQKLATYAQGKEITIEMVEELVPRTLEQDVFQLTENLVKRKQEKVFQIWEDLLYQKEEPIKILALIIRQLRLLLQVKLFSQKGWTEKEIAKQLKIHPYPVKLAYQQGLAFQEKELKESLKRAIETEKEIKEGKIERQLGVERLMFYLLEK